MYRSLFLRASLYALAASFAASGQAPQEVQFDRTVLERDAMTTKVAPHWKAMCDLVDALLDEGRRAKFLEQYRSIPSRYSLPDQLARLAEQCRPRLVPLRRDPKKLDWQRTSLEYYESPSGNSVVVVQREPGTERILRIKGVFLDQELVDFSFMNGSRVAAPLRGKEAQRIDRW